MGADAWSLGSPLRVMLSDSCSIKRYKAPHVHSSGERGGDDHDSSLRTRNAQTFLYFYIRRG